MSELIHLGLGLVMWWLLWSVFTDVDDPDEEEEDDELEDLWRDVGGEAHR